MLQTSIQLGQKGGDTVLHKKLKSLALFVSVGIFFCAAAERSDSPLIRTVHAEVPTYSCPVETGGTMSYTALVEKYADDESEFVILEGKDGIRVHYKDQGSGPAILLIHSSSGDVKDWDPWVDVLKEDYRVIRFELPAFGLTGMVPSGNYSVERFLTLIDALMDHLEVPEFAVVGMSYGGPVAFRYAGTRVNRVTALVLGNSAGIEYGGRGGTVERERNPNPVFTPSTRAASFTESFLKLVINDPAKITPELIERKTDFANMECRDWESFVATGLYERGNPERVLSHVRAPSLVYWGGANTQLSLETAQAFADALYNAESIEKIIIEGGGHLVHIGQPQKTVQAVKAFFDRKLK